MSTGDHVYFASVAGDKRRELRRLAAAACAAGVRNLRDAANQYWNTAAAAPAAASAATPRQVYVSSLHKLYQLDKISESSGAFALGLGHNSSLTSLLCSTARDTKNRESLIKKITQLERQLKIAVSDRWKPGMAEYDVVLADLYADGLAELRGRIESLAATYRYNQLNFDTHNTLDTGQQHRRKQASLLGNIRGALDVYCGLLSEHEGTALTEISFTNDQVSDILKGVMPWASGGDQGASVADVQYYGKHALACWHELDRNYEEIQILRREIVHMQDFYEARVNSLSSAIASLSSSSAPSPLELGKVHVLRRHLSVVTARLAEVRAARQGVGNPQPRRRSNLSGAFADPSAEFEAVDCMTCKQPQPEDSMVLCDGCWRAQHTHCMTPPLPAVPEHEVWFCAECNKDDGV